jgi:hypothetical protein
MSQPPSPEDRVEALVGVGRKVLGGPWFIQLRKCLEAPVHLGPYPNADVAREEAKRIKQYLAALLRSARPAPGAGSSAQPARGSAPGSPLPVRT